MAIEDNKINIKVGMNTRGFQNGMKTMKGGFKTLNRTIGAFSTAFVGQQIFQLGKQFADAAGEMETVERSFARSFAGISSSVESELKKLAKSLNRNETQLKKGAVSFNAFFSGLGFVSNEAAKMSVKMQTLSLDLASFFGIADSNAQKRFLSALAGSPEVLDQFGINLKQSALQLELYRMGLTSTVQNTNEVIKTQARLNIIMRSMTDSGIIGDARRGLETYEGQLKQFSSAWVTFSEDLGKLVIPSITAVTKKLTALFNIYKAGIEIIKKGKISKSLEELSKIELSKIDDLEVQAEVKILTTVTKSETPEENNAELVSAMENVEDQRQRIYSDEDLARLAKINIAIRNIADSMEARKKFGESNLSLMQLSNKLEDEKAAIEKKLTDQLKSEEVLRNQALLGIQSEIDLEENKKNVKEELNSLSELSSMELGAMAHEQALLYDLELKRNALTGTSLDQLAKIKKFYEILVSLSNKIKPPPKSATMGAVDISGKEVDLKTGYVISDAESKNNMGVLLGLGDMDQQKKAIQEMIARNTAGLAAIAKASAEGMGKAVPVIEQGAIQIIDILRPITDAMSEIWMQMLTPPDTTISKEEQREKTLAAFGGIMVGLGQALFSLGMGSLLTSMGLDQLGKNPPLAIAMMGAGSGLIAIGKGKLQKARNMASARSAGGGASGGNGGGSFTGMMEAIQGEQVFRLAGNDLVTAINRTNTFQGTIGG